MATLTRRLFHHSSHYSAGQFLILLSSLVSFPILTRIFSPDEYGLMNLISNALVILLAISKGGFQHSIIRYYDEFSARSNRQEFESFTSSIIFGGLAFALSVTIVWTGVNMLLSNVWQGEHQIGLLMLLASGLIFLRAGESLLLAFLRAEQQTIALNAYRVIVRYFSLGMVLLFLFFLSRTLTGFYTAHLFSMSLAIGVLLVMRVRRSRPRVFDFSGSIFREALFYGFPLVGFEVCSLLLNYVDKFFIQFMMDATAVGLYSAAYNLSDYVKDLVVLPLSSAVAPIYMRVWAERGKEHTEKFLTGALRSYVVLAVPIVLGYSAVSGDVIRFVASEDFAAGSIIVPWVIVGLLINGTIPIIGAGLYIQKKTKILVFYMLVATAINAAANMMLIPNFGLQGAAIAKLLSYSALMVCVTIVSRKFIAFSMPWASMLKYLLAGLLMFAVITTFQFSQPILGLVLHIFIGALTYGVLIIVLDKPVRENALALVDLYRKYRKGK